MKTVKCGVGGNFFSDVNIFSFDLVDGGGTSPPGGWVVFV